MIPEPSWRNYSARPSRSAFGGTLELTYQDGQLALVRKTETFKIHPQENKLTCNLKQPIT
jgi:hypothetical protein